MILEQLNRWQRLWLVLTASALVALALIVPFIEVYTPQIAKVEYRWALA